MAEKKASVVAEKKAPVVAGKKASVVAAQAADALGGTDHLSRTMHIYMGWDVYKENYVLDDIQVTGIVNLCHSYCATAFRHKLDSYTGLILLFCAVTGDPTSGLNLTPEVWLDP
jgi:hypothetical protein